MDYQTLLRTHRKKILETASRYGASHVRVFGSVARGTADESSDIDLLVDLASDRSLMDLGGLLYELRQLLGVEVDVVAEEGLRSKIRENVMAEALEL